MLDALLQALSNISGSMLGWMAFGIVVTSVIAVIPGLGGTFAMVMLLPVAFALPPEHGLAMLMAAVAVDGTANVITSVLFGVPGSATGVATILDGYPMAQRGEASRAISASLVASAVGGIIGAIALMAMLPALRPLVTSMRSPEFFALILAALVFIAFVGEGSMLKSLIAGFAGLMLSFVGMEISTGTPRYDFGHLYLWDGLQLVPVMIGLFAVAEMISLLLKGGSVAQAHSELGHSRQLARGAMDVLRGWRTTVTSSITGIVVGVAPGLGGSAGQFIAYAQAAKVSKRGKKFGTGEVDGVIAPSAATNSVDAGGLVPTLAFGIPGSAPMAVMLAAMISLGIDPGQEMLTTHLDIVWLFVITLVLANIAATTLCLVSSGVLTRAANVSSTILAAPILVISLFAAYATTQHLGDVVTALVFGAVGFAMMKTGYSRASLIVGFVLGILLERHFLLSMRIYDWEFLTRPVTLTILVVAAVALFVGLVRPLTAKTSERTLT